MEYNKPFFEKVFSNKRMERYFRLYEDEKKAIDHCQSNIELAESFYPCLSVFEVTLRNALSMLEWMNKDLPLWLQTIDRFEDTKKRISLRMNWNNE